MSESVKMPALGESVTEGTVTRWLKAVGESVEVDEPLLEVSTDKVDTEVPSPVAGVVEKILVEEDETVEVGTELAVIGDGSSSGSEDSGSGSSDSAAASESSDGPAFTDAAQEKSIQADETQPATSGADSDPEQAEPETSEDTEPALAEKPAAGTASSGEASGTEITLPALGESVTEGTVTRWLKEVGDAVEVDEPLLEVSTDKVDTEVPSPVAGTLLAIKVAEDETVDVGTVVAVVGDASAQSASEPEKAPEPEKAEEPEAEEPKQEAPKQESAPQQEVAPQKEPVKQEDPKQEAPQQDEQKQEAAPAPLPDTAGIYVTPLVRKLASQHGVDLSSVTGTGVGGRIRKQDVLDAAAPKAAPAAEQSAPAAPKAAPALEVSELRGTTEKMSRLRKVISVRMVEALQTMAQLTTVIEVDVTKVAKLRAAKKDAFQEATGQKLTYLPFFAKAAVEALQVYPKLNARIDGDQIVYPAGENLAIAVDTPRGLLTPVIKDAGDLDIAGFAGGINDLAARTRDNKVGPDELSGGTFTLTNTGSAGALFDTPIVPVPNVAILGVGSIVKRPVVISGPDGDVIAIRSMVYLAISYDHRLVDGADAGRYLSAVKRRLEEGAFEADLGL
ncbi:2-oxoglutarate dehydrogenase, E2 component, dihydrolipoamide succinyltransferase [Serinibacter arcticus]|uniref:Dihydrolipoamide acetyltransferase component of pyruvate dehydrogenase complex n=1 Tax=Serinibacter arcticus TaxID=1655435 RepID=A0A4Z1E5G3_9MICO|nr:2-oxoglutarate dehydrogenase, E2 component, dihydrolipoamide succinyltransferase [Serinibacter arcticus]TGO04861.1 Dihydrolipoamide acyltransferase component of branched-chain alpha-keto acid dehydrogenase complex [Serinibacter arcticus]